MPCRCAGLIKTSLTQRYFLYLQERRKAIVQTLAALLKDNMTLSKLLNQHYFMCELEITTVNTRLSLIYNSVGTMLGYCVAQTQKAVVKVPLSLLFMC